MHPLLVQMSGITKAFPGVVANDGASLELRAGEVHALLGENGAGKTTLMNILGGLYRPDAGEIRIRSRAAEIRSPGQAIALGIGMVHQRFKLVPGFTVAENITLGMREPRFVIRPRSLEESIGAFARDRGLPVHPGARVWQLSVGEQQRVEIVKALWRGAEILIMDEPTAVLTPREVRDLFGVMRRMAGEGKAIVFITHKLIEVMEIADRVTVMRQGRHRATVDKAETSPGELASLMMGRQHEFPVCAAGPGAPGAPRKARDGGDTERVGGGRFTVSVTGTWAGESAAPADATSTVAWWVPAGSPAHLAVTVTVQGADAPDTAARSQPAWPR